MENTRIIYERLLNEHRNLSNQISEIKTESFELNDEHKRRIKELEKKQIYLMNQIRSLFNGK